MIWKILGWLLIFSAIGNIFGTGNFFVALIALGLSWLCFRKAGGGKTQSSTAPQSMDDIIPYDPSTATIQPVTSQSYRSVTPVSSSSTTPIGTGAARRLSADQRIAEIISTRFPEYSVKRNTTLASLTSEWWVCSCGAENDGSFCCECGKGKPANAEWTCRCGCRNTSKFCSDCGQPKPAEQQHEPIDFLMMRDGMPKLAILMVDRKHWNTKAIRNTIESCEAAGIPWQRYFEEYDNEVQYVTDRIRGDLR